MNESATRLFVNIAFLLFVIPINALVFAAEEPGILEEVMVTAQKREQSLQDVPIAVSALSMELMNDYDVRKIEDLPKLTPSLIMVELALAQNLGIRGVFSGENQGFEQSVGTYVDGIYRGRPLQARIPFLDVERIEVLRGPVSLLFGKNSVAGALNIITAKPTEELEASFTVTQTRFDSDLDEQEYRGFISGSITDSVRGRFAVRYLDSGGFMDNPFLDRGEPSFDEIQVRAILEIDLTDNLLMTLKAERATFDRKGFIAETADERPAETGPFAGLTYAEILFALGEPEEVLDNIQNFSRHSGDEYSDNEANEFVMTLDYLMGDYTLTSITGYSDYTYDDLLDADFTAANVFKLKGAEDFEQFSQEIRLTSPLFDRFNYIVGAYFDSTEFNFFDAILIDHESILGPLLNAVGPGFGDAMVGTATPRTLDQEAETWAAFFQASWSFTDRLRLNGGLRYSYEKKDARRVLTITSLDGGPPPSPLTPVLYSALFNISTHEVAGDRSDSNFLPTVILEYDYNDQTLLYASWRQGVKSGGYDARSNNAPPVGTFEFDQEENETFELGAKTTIGGVAQLNVAAYYSNYQDMQVSVFDGVLGFDVQNAAEATIMGLEIDSRWVITPNLWLTGSVAITNFEWDEYYGPCYVGRIPDSPDGNNCNFKGDTNQFLPDWNGNIGFNYRRDTGSRYEFGIASNLYFSDKYFAAGNHDPGQIQDSYTELDARISFGRADGRWRLALIGKNLTDKAIVADAADTPLAASTFGAPSFLNLMKKPRSIALQFSISL